MDEKNNLNNGVQKTFLNDLKWLSTKEAAEYLRVSVGSMKNLVYRGIIRPRKLGRLNRFKRADLDRLLEASFQGGY